MTVGKVEANASVMMAPDADQTKHSIWPGVSMMTFLNLSDFFSTRLMTWSIFVEKRLSDVTIAPFGPKLYSSITFLYFTESLISIFAPYGTFRTAGSRLITYGGVFLAWRWEFSLCINVVLPDPAIPIQITVAGAMVPFGKLVSFCLL